MKTNKVLGVLFGLAGIALAVYVGIWILFVGGIVDLVHGLGSNPWDAMLIAVGLVKAFLLPETVAAVIFLVFSAVGVLLFGWTPKRYSIMKNGPISRVSSRGK